MAGNKLCYIAVKKGSRDGAANPGVCQRLEHLVLFMQEELARVIEGTIAGILPKHHRIYTDEKLSKSAPKAQCLENHLPDASKTRQSSLGGSAFIEGLLVASVPASRGAAARLRRRNFVLRFTYA